MRRWLIRSRRLWKRLFPRGIVRAGRPPQVEIYEQDDTAHLSLLSGPGRGHHPGRRDRGGRTRGKVLAPEARSALPIARNQLLPRGSLRGCFGARRRYLLRQPAAHIRPGDKERAHGVAEWSGTMGEGFEIVPQRKGCREGAHTPCIGR